MKKIMSYILNPIKEDKEGAAKMNTKIRKAIGIVGIIMAVYIIRREVARPALAVRTGPFHAA